METIIYDDKTIEITRKNIKNANLKVYPDCSIKLSVPLNTKKEQIIRFIGSKNLWLKLKLEEVEKQKRKLNEQFVSGEDILINGKRYILKVMKSTKNFVKKGKGKTLEMYISPRATSKSKERLINEFLKCELEKKLEKYLNKWQEKMGISINYYVIRNMKTRWGTYSEKKNSITFNLQLAKKTNDEIQYVIIHELLHSIERKHNNKFYNLLSKYYPKWKKCHENLNILL